MLTVVADAALRFAVIGARLAGRDFFEKLRSLDRKHKDTQLPEQNETLTPPFLTMLHSPYQS
jgi:hypothetical protein